MSVCVAPKTCGYPHHPSPPPPSTSVPRTFQNYTLKTMKTHTKASPPPLLYTRGHIGDGAELKLTVNNNFRQSHRKKWKTLRCILRYDFFKPKKILSCTVKDLSLYWTVSRYVYSYVFASGEDLSLIWFRHFKVLLSDPPPLFLLFFLVRFEPVTAVSTVYSLSYHKLSLWQHMYLVKNRFYATRFLYWFKRWNTTEVVYSLTPIWPYICYNFA